MESAVAQSLATGREEQDVRPFRPIELWQREVASHTDRATFEALVRSRSWCVVCWCKVRRSEDAFWGRKSDEGSPSGFVHAHCYEPTNGVLVYIPESSEVQRVLLPLRKGRHPSPLPSQHEDRVSRNRVLLRPHRCRRKPTHCTRKTYVMLSRR